MENVIKNKKPQQRISYKDAMRIKEKIIKEFKDPCHNATEYIEDYAEANQLFINDNVVNEIIKKLTR